MKRTIVLALAVALACALLPGVALAQDPWITGRIIRTSAGDIFSQPVMSGDWVVYSLSDSGAAFNVWAYNLKTQEQFALHAQTALQNDASISGTKVVWGDRRNGNFNIYLYDLATRHETTVRDGATAPGAYPDISGNRIVYNDNGPKVHLYTISTGSDVILGDGQNARVDGDYVVWQTDSVPSQIRVCNLKTGSRFNLTTGGAGSLMPEISGSVVAWQGSIAGDIHVFYRYLNEDTNHEVVPAGSVDHNVTIANNRLYFKSNIGGAQQLYLHDLGGQAMTPIPISGDMTGADAWEDAWAAGNTIVCRAGNEIYLAKVWAPTVTISGPSRVPYKAVAMVTGTISDFGYRIGNTPALWDQVKPQASLDKFDWRTNTDKFGTNSNGVYTWETPALTRKVYFRTIYRGSWDPFKFASHLSGISPVISITPRAYLTKPSVPASIKHDKKSSAWGYLEPVHTAGTHPVKVEYWKKRSGRYTLRKTVWATAMTYASSRNKYSAYASVPSAGRWRFRAIYPTSSTNAYTATGWVYRTVE